MKRVLFVVVAVFALTALAAKDANLITKSTAVCSNSMCGAEQAGGARIA